MDGYLKEPQFKKAMLHQNKILVYVLIISSFASCTQRREKIKDYETDYSEMYREYRNFSKRFVGDDVYNFVLKSANDSLSLWAGNSLKSYIQNKYDQWKTDSLICFNRDKNKCIMAILFRSTYFDYATQDDVKYFYGVKINNKWWFFKGPAIVIAREIGNPSTFEQLHEEAMKNVFRDYLKKSPTGEWEINDSFFNDLTAGGICYECKTQEDFDKVYLEIVNKNWRHKDTTQYLPSQ